MVLSDEERLKVSEDGQWNKLMMQFYPYDHRLSQQVYPENRDSDSRWTSMVDSLVMRLKDDEKKIGEQGNRRDLIALFKNQETGLISRVNSILAKETWIEAAYQGLSVNSRENTGFKFWTNSLSRGLSVVVSSYVTSLRKILICLFSLPFHLKQPDIKRVILDHIYTSQKDVAKLGENAHSFLTFVHRVIFEDVLYYDTPMFASSSYKGKYASSAENRFRYLTIYDVFYLNLCMVNNDFEWGAVALIKRCHLSIVPQLIQSASSRRSFEPIWKLGLESAIRDDNAFLFIFLLKLYDAIVEQHEDWASWIISILKMHCAWFKNYEKVSDEIKARLPDRPMSFEECILQRRSEKILSLIEDNFSVKLKERTDLSHTDYHSFIINRGTMKELFQQHSYEHLLIRIKQIPVALPDRWEFFDITNYMRQVPRIQLVQIGAELTATISSRGEGTLTEMLKFTPISSTTLADVDSEDEEAYDSDAEYETLMIEDPTQSPSVVARFANQAESSSSSSHSSMADIIVATSMEEQDKGSSSSSTVGKITTLMKDNVWVEEKTHQLRDRSEVTSRKIMLPSPVALTQAPYSQDIQSLNTCHDYYLLKYNKEFPPANKEIPDFALMKEVVSNNFSREIKRLKEFFRGDLEWDNPEELARTFYNQNMKKKLKGLNKTQLGRDTFYLVEIVRDHFRSVFDQPSLRLRVVGGRKKGLASKIDQTYYELAVLLGERQKALDHIINDSLSTFYKKLVDPDFGDFPSGFDYVVTRCIANDNPKMLEEFLTDRYNKWLERTGNERTPTGRFSVLYKPMMYNHPLYKTMKVKEVYKSQKALMHQYPLYIAVVCHSKKILYHLQEQGFDFFADVRKKGEGKIPEDAIDRFDLFLWTFWRNTYIKNLYREDYLMARLVYSLTYILSVYDQNLLMRFGKVDRKKLPLISSAHRVPTSTLRLYVNIYRRMEKVYLDDMDTMGQFYNRSVSKYLGQLRMKAILSGEKDYSLGFSLEEYQNKLVMELDNISESSTTYRRKYNLLVKKEAERFLMSMPTPPADVPPTRSERKRKKKKDKREKHQLEEDVLAEQVRNELSRLLISSPSKNVKSEALENVRIVQEMIMEETPDDSAANVLISEQGIDPEESISATELISRAVFQVDDAGISPVSKKSLGKRPYSPSRELEIRAVKRRLTKERKKASDRKAN